MGIATLLTMGLTVSCGRRASRDHNMVSLGSEFMSGVYVLGPLHVRHSNDGGHDVQLN